MYSLLEGVVSMKTFLMLVYMYLATIYDFCLPCMCMFELCVYTNANVMKIAQV